MEKDKQKIIRQEIVKVNGDVAHKEYLKVKLLGKGGFANCFLTKNLETGALTATKIVNKSILLNPRTKIKLENEIKIHKMMHSEYIVKFYNSFQDSDNVYVMMELCPNNTLNEYLNEKKRLSVPESQKFLRQLATGVKYLHSKNIIHRDIKLGNIFLGQQKKVKIGDFGLATKIEFQTEKKRTICGTPNYLAPEIIKGVGYKYEVDIWSIGIILFTFLVGTPPFQTQDLQETYEKILQNKYHYYGIEVPLEAKQLISRILNINPAHRPTIQQILESEFMRYGKPTILPQLQVLGLMQNKQNIEQHCPLIVSVLEIKEGLCYLLLNGSKGLILEKQSIIVPESKDYVHVVTRDKVDKIRKVLLSELQESMVNLKFLVQSVKFQCSNQRARTQKYSPEGKFIYVRKHVANKNLYVFRMSNQTIHFKWSDGYYAIADKTMKVWLSDGKKDQAVIGIDGEKTLSKGMAARFALVKQLVAKC